MARFIIEYQPSISDDAKELIRDSCDESMSSEDSQQFCLEDVLNTIGEDLEKDDFDYLKKLEKEKVNYIEI